MNLLLFDSHELDRPLPRRDPRAIHLVDVLRRQPGDSFDAGQINGPRGKGSVTSIDADAVTIAFSWSTQTENAEPITLLVGMTRPQTARDILRDSTTLGVGALHFIRTEKGDVNYAQSSLWTSGEWRRHLIAGAEQAFATILPEVSHHQALDEALARLKPNSTRLALDNYEASMALAEYPFAEGAEHVLAIGAERGWAAAERELLRAHDFTLVHLGTRVLRTETACVAALAIVRTRLKL